MSEWDDIEARLERLKSADGTWPAGDFTASGDILPDIRAALEEIERRGLQYPDDLGVSRDAAGLSARCAELRDRLVAQGKRAEAAEAKLAEEAAAHDRTAECRAIDQRQRDEAEMNLILSQAEIERLREALVALIKSCEGHDVAVAAVIGRPPGWRDAYLDAARAALRGGGE